MPYKNTPERNAKLAENTRRWRANHPEYKAIQSQRSREWRRNHPLEAAARDTMRAAASKAWRDANPPRTDIPDLPAEEWRPVVGYEPHYSISNKGRVKRIARGGGTRIGRLLTPCIDTTGYFGVSLCRDGGQKRIAIHVMIAEAFIRPRVGHNHVNHIDGCKTNNAPANLEWVTPLENVRHAARMGLRRPRGPNRKQAV